MTTIKNVCRCFFFFSLWLTCALKMAEAATTAEQLLADINRLPANERQARLERGARQEGSVVWYAAMNRNELSELKTIFEAEYPFITLELVAGRSRDLVSRALTENRAGKMLGDILNANSLYLDTLVKAKAVSAYRTPYRKFLRDGFFDEQGFFNGIYSTPLVFAYYTKLVNAKDVPQTIEDLLQPKWKGKLAIDENSYDWLMPIMDYYGDEKGKEVARKLGEQNFVIGKGQSLMGQLLAAGEFPINVATYHNVAYSL